MLEDYVRNNAGSWFEWSKKIGLGVERMEDLLLVSGLTLASSWAAVAFVDNALEAEISLGVQALPNGGTSFVWSKIHGNVAYHHSQVDLVCPFCFIYLPCTNFSPVVIERTIHPLQRTNVSSSGASEQSAAFSGPGPYGLQQNHFLTTPSTTVRTRSKRPEFRVLCWVTTIRGRSGQKVQHLADCWEC